MAFPLQIRLTNPWIVPPPFNNPQFGHNATFHTFHPRLTTRSANILERVLENFSNADNPFPNAEQTNLAIALNASIMWRDTARTEAWAYCLGLINVTRNPHNFDYNIDPQLAEDLNCHWTPLNPQTNRQPLFGPVYPRIRYLYVIHLHRGASYPTNVYTLSVYDREWGGRMEHHDPGTGDFNEAATRSANVHAFWANSIHTFNGCPNFGVFANQPWLYGGLTEIGCLNRRPPTGNPPSNLHVRRTMLHVISWCNILMRDAHAPGWWPFPVLPNELTIANGFYGLAHLRFALFLLLYRNRHGQAAIVIPLPPPPPPFHGPALPPIIIPPVPPLVFTNDARFNNENSAWGAYGQFVSVNFTFKQIINATWTINYPAGVWPPNTPGPGVLTWEQALGNN